MTDAAGRFTAEPGAERPWERPPPLLPPREPERAGFLLALGIVSIVLGAGSLCLSVPALLGLPLAPWSRT